MIYLKKEIHTLMLLQNLTLIFLTLIKKSLKILKEKYGLKII